MAAYTGVTAVHPTSGASVVDTCALSAPIANACTVVNRSGVADIFFTVASGTVAGTAPTVGGNDTYVVPAAVGSMTVPVEGAFVCSVITASAQNYSVQGSL